jgi:hypothetical protein
MFFKKQTKRIYRLRMGDDGPLGRFAELRQVHHVAHLRPAQRSLRRGRIASRLVDDDCRLDGSDLSVCWLAPNQWAESLFGTVQFTFDFADIVRSRKIYWVEGVRGRGLHTCRLLITDSDVTGLRVKAYDPELTEGPLRRFRERWFWKDDVHLELMVEGHLPLRECRKVATVLHRRDRCGKTCGEFGRSESDTAARLLTGLIRGRYSLPAASYEDHGRASALLQNGWFGLVEALGLLEDTFGGGIRGKRRVDATVVKALKRLSKSRTSAAAKVGEIAGAHRVRASLRRLLQRSAGVRLGRSDDIVIGLRPLAQSRVATPRGSGCSTGAKQLASRTDVAGKRRRAEA